MVKRNNVKRSSTESALILREVYDDVLGLTTDDPELENAFSQVLFREEEDISDFNSLLGAVNEFIALDMAKHLGISIKEYLDSTPREVAAFIKICEEKIAMLNKALEATQRDTEKRTKELSANLSNTSSGFPPELDL